MLSHLTRHAMRCDQKRRDFSEKRAVILKSVDTPAGQERTRLRVATATSQREARVGLAGQEFAGFRSLWSPAFLS
jgi:hypothetical protein